MNDLTIGPGTRVTLHFSLALDDGTLVDSTFDREPAVFDVGDGSLLPGYEDVLMGLRAGDETHFDIKPEHGFGQHNFGKQMPCHGCGHDRAGILLKPERLRGFEVVIWQQWFFRVFALQPGADH